MQFQTVWDCGHPKIEVICTQANQLIMPMYIYHEICICLFMNKALLKCSVCLCDQNAMHSNVICACHVILSLEDSHSVTCSVRFAYGPADATATQFAYGPADTTATHCLLLQ